MLAHLLLPLLAEALDANLVGVVLSKKPELSVAIVRMAGRSRVVTVGENVGPGRVTAIAPLFVTLDVDGERVELRLRGETGPTAIGEPPGPIAAASQPEPPPANPEAPPVRVLRRKDVDARLVAEIPRILGETAMFPVTDNGQIVGFTLTRIPEGTLLSDVGLRAGDVLTRINDSPVDSLSTLIGLWPQLQGASQIRASVLRAGQPVVLSVEIR